MYTGKNICLNQENNLKVLEFMLISVNFDNLKIWLLKLKKICFLLSFDLTVSIQVLSLSFGVYKPLEQNNSCSIGNSF